MARRRKKWIEETDLVKRDGALVLTFVNTGSRRSKPLRDYEDLLTWVAGHGSLKVADASHLRQLAADQATAATTVFAIAEELHGVLSRIVNAAADNTVASTASVEALNELLTKVTPRRRLVPIPRRVGLAWYWPEEPERDLFRPLRPIVESAVDLLTSGDCRKVKRCAAEDCDVLFLSGKNPGMPRKWCSTKSCSDPVRSREYYRSVTKPARARTRASTKNFLG